MFGISIYLNEEINEKQQAYIEQARKHGFKWIFTSLHIPEDDSSKLRSRFKQLAQMAKQAGMDLIADVSPVSLQLIEASIDQVEELLEWGVTGLRVDYGIDSDQIAFLSTKMQVALNASTLTNGDWQEILHAGADISNIEAWHNFYPRPETGLDDEYIKEKNEWLCSLGLATMAFVAGDSDKRGPIFEGLPTLEKHRSEPPFAAAIELVRQLHTKKVLIGDPHLSEEAFQQFKWFGQEGCIPLRAEPFTDVSLYQSIQTNRQDPARDCIRSVESRGFAQVGRSTLEPFQMTARQRGSITVDNKQYLRYAGEMQIVLNPLPADEKVNVIGKVIDKDLDILSFIGAGQKFVIIWNE